MFSPVPHRIQRLQMLDSVSLADHEACKNSKLGGEVWDTLYSCIASRDFGWYKLMSVSGHVKEAPNFLNTAPCVLNLYFFASVSAQLLFSIHITKFNLFLFPAKE